MSRRPVNPSRRYGDSGGGALFSSKSRSPPYLPIALIILVRFRLFRTFLFEKLPWVLILVLIVVVQGGLAVFAYLHVGSGGPHSCLLNLSSLSLCSTRINLIRIRTYIIETSLYSLSVQDLVARNRLLCGSKVMWIFHFSACSLNFWSQLQLSAIYCFHSFESPFSL